MKLIALKTLYRRDVGDTFEEGPAASRLLLALGWAKPADDDAPSISTSRPRRTYQRRDMRAEE